ncbi:MAG: hypothetical protein JKY00_02110 [Roseicyclus sp.]|nr:hypothetical protein [Roseicyclus sp.]
MSDQAVTVTPPLAAADAAVDVAGAVAVLERGSGRANALEGRFAATHTSLAARFSQA